uniref:Uncharacterized protein n=1 Tax=Anopheles atroparvus TaxID=41427 RepID=A0A182J8Y6_ANOAO
MEKHKTYHQKDEMLLRDGYKKFLKTEDCTYKDCRFSRVCNHIHCMHENCHYVLHSSGQLLSHKRKHERMDTEVDYRRFQMARSLLSKINQPKPDEAVPAGGESVPERSAGEEEPRLSPAPTGQEGARLGSKNPFLDLLSVMAEITFRTLPIQMMYHMRLQLLQQMSYEQVFAPENVEMLRNLTVMGSIEEAYLSQLYGGAMGVSPTSLMEQATGPMQCAVGSGNEKALATKRKYKPEESIDHLEQPADVPLYLKKESLSSTPPRSKLLSNPSVDYRLLKKDDGAVSLGQASIASSLKGSPLESGSPPVDRDHRTLLETANFLQFSSSKTLFNRKRGRPRKNHVMEVYNNVQDSPQAIFTSFKLEKNDSKPSTDVHSASVSSRTEAAPATTTDAGRNGSTESFGRGISEGLSASSSTQQYFPAGGGYMSTAVGVPQLGPLDSSVLFGNFSQLLERHMREVKHEPVATVTQNLDRSAKARSNHLKCVVCRNLFETFADIKNHECHGDRAALDKPLLAFPPSLARPSSVMDYRTAVVGAEAEANTTTAYRGGVPSGSTGPVLATTTVPSNHAKESISLVKTAGTFFPDVNANKLKYA